MTTFGRYRKPFLFLLVLLRECSVLEFPAGLADARSTGSLASATLRHLAIACVTFVSGLISRGSYPENGHL